MRLCVLISVVCVLAALGSAQPACRDGRGAGRPKPGFDPTEVVRQVRTRRDMTDMTLGAGRATLRPGNTERDPSGQRNHFRSGPTSEGSEQPAAGDEQFVDDGEFLLDTNSTLVPAPGYQNGPVIAFDGANYLVVWEDHRGNYYADIWGARVTPQGTVLDTWGFVISQGADEQLYPVIAFDGENFLVVWEDYRGKFYSDIYGARVTPGGTVLDPQGFVISHGADDQWYPTLGFDGTDFLVAWEDYRNDPEEPHIYGARVTSGGTVLDPDGIVISQAARGQYGPALGSDGANFLVAWQDCRDSGYAYIYGARVTSGGTVLDPDGFAILRVGGLQASPAIASDGANYLVVWQDYYNHHDFDIYGARVSPQGTLLGTVLISRAASMQMSPALVFDGANFLVTWQDDRAGDYNFDIYGARVTPRGILLDPSGFVISDAANWQWYPALAFDGANFLVVWQDFRNGVGYTDIYGARVTTAGTVLDPQGFIIPQAARDELTPALAFDGANYLVVWEDHRSGSYSDIYGARVAPGGTVLDPDGIAISRATSWQNSPAIVFDGANYFVVWQDYRVGDGTTDIYGARVTPSGWVLDPKGILISQAANWQYSPALAFDGANYLVVWEDNRAFDDYNFDIYGARVTLEGWVLDPDGFAISQAAGDQCDPNLAFDGANFLVVWTDYRSGGYSDIYGARVTSQGTVLDPQGFVISQGVLDQSTPVLGFDGANFFVAWADYRSGVYPDILGARVAPQGAVLDPDGFVISRDANGQNRPALAFDGGNFLVVWEDYRIAQSDIYGAVVTPSGVVIDTGAVVRQEGNQLHPALTRGTGNHPFLVYQGWAGTVGGKTYNTYRTWGKFDPAPGSIEESKQPLVYGSRPSATIVRGVLMIGDRGRKTGDRVELLDVSGCKVLGLKPGANDVRALVPGVYFCRLTAGSASCGEPSAVGRQPSAVTKVVVTR